MIIDNRIPAEIKTAIESLEAIKYVYERDEMISSKYIKEKVNVVNHICNWLIDITNEEK